MTGRPIYCGLCCKGAHSIGVKDICAAGQLVLREYPLATAVRSQFVSSTCHICLKEIPTGHSAVQVGKCAWNGQGQACFVHQGHLVMKGRPFFVCPHFGRFTK